MCWRDPREAASGSSPFATSGEERVRERDIEWEKERERERERERVREIYVKGSELEIS